MKYLGLITNRYCLAITLIAFFALLCIMATSEVTLTVIISKAIGFGLIWAMSSLFHKWDKEGKVEPIKELFNDDDPD